MKSASFALFALIGSSALVVACRDSGSGSDAGANSQGGSSADGAGSQGGDSAGGAGQGGKNQGGSGPCTMTGAEDTEASCSDNVDNDCDGFVDCNDFSCSTFPACIKPAEASNPACSDGMDNDDNGFTDCDDNNCKELSACTKELSNAKCADGEDNDGDADVDCDDADCQTEGIVVCDGTTPVDVEPAQYVEAANAACTNGLNDDASATNTFIDCSDNSCLINPDVTECKGLPRENTNELCSDGEDNDLDSVSDCDDPGCRREGVVVCDGMTPVKVPEAQWKTLSNADCEDGTDQDSNNFTDCKDFGCQQNPDVDVCPETNDAECGDNVDNNDNTFVDCDDFSCSKNPYVTVCKREFTYAECSDGVDNNGDSFVDCNDFGCKPMNGTPSPACL